MVSGDFVRLPGGSLPRLSFGPGLIEPADDHGNVIGECSRSSARKLNESISGILGARECDGADVVDGRVVEQTVSSRHEGAASVCGERLRYGTPGTQPRLPSLILG